MKTNTVDNKSVSIYCYCSLVHVICFVVLRLANYGNPLCEMLNLKWINKDEASLTALKVSKPSVLLPKKLNNADIFYCLCKGTTCGCAEEYKAVQSQMKRLSAAI